MRQQVIPLAGQDLYGYGEADPGDPERILQILRQIIKKYS